MVRSEKTATYGATQRRGGRCLVRSFWLLFVVAVALAAMNRMAQGVCCICEGAEVPPGDSCVPNTMVDCFTGQNSCATFCGEFQGTVRTCCESAADCSGGVVVGNCAPGNNVCFQTATGSGFCDGTCTNGTATPSETPTDTATPTSTPTGTPTSSPTNTPTPQPNGSTCTNAGQCASGNCVDTVCCNTACTDPPTRCNLAGQVGTCASAAAEAPALTPWGLIAGLVLLAGTAAWAIRRRVR
jgi:MYXO-CTERM domain-containing protein